MLTLLESARTIQVITVSCNVYTVNTFRFICTYLTTLHLDDISLSIYCVRHIIEPYILGVAHIN